jgi:phage protein D
MVTRIAAEHGLLPKVSEALGAVSVIHLDQNEESDLHLLTRLARESGAVAKPVAGYLLFVSRGEAKSASGRELPTIKVPPSQVIRHRMT